MADQIAVVEFNTADAVGGFLDITSPSITETFSAAVLIYSKSVTDDSNSNHAVMGVGFVGVDGDVATQTRDVAVSVQAENGVTTAQDCNTIRSTLACIKVATGPGPGSTVGIEAEYSSSVSGGFKLAFTTQTNTTKGVAILFAGLSKAATGSAGFFDSAASHEEVGLSPFWQPDLIITRSSDNTLTSDTENGTVAIGFATNRSPIQQVSAYINFDDSAATSDSDGYLRSDACSSGFIGTTRTEMDRIAVTSFDSTGFNAQAAATAGINSPQFNYLALKFTDSAIPIVCDNVAVSSSTGTQSFNLGIQPQVVFGMSTLMASEDTLTDGATASAAGYFAFSASKARAYTVNNEEGIAGTKNAKTRQGEYAVLTMTHTATVAQQATLGSMTATGFDLSFSTATAGFLTVLAIGQSAQTTVVSETENITESVTAFLNATLVLSDALQIGESALVDTFDVTTSQGPQGVTLEAGAERGTSFSAGSEAGTVL